MNGNEAPAGAHHLRQTCRACGSRDLQRFLELGPTPLANSFLRTPEQFAGEHAYPLDVYFCVDCTLVQLLDVIDPEVLFRDYIYVSGTSETMAAHFKGYAEQVVALLELGADDLVAEAASNDGSLLSYFKSHGVAVLGVEPARLRARARRRHGARIGTIRQALHLVGPMQVVHNVNAGRLAYFVAR